MAAAVMQVSSRDVDARQSRAHSRASSAARRRMARAGDGSTERMC